MLTIRLEMERLKHSIQAALVDHNNELEAYISHSLSEQVTEEWVKKEIDAQVKLCLKKCIENISDDWELQRHLKSILVEAIKGGLKPEKSEG